MCHTRFLVLCFVGIFFQKAFLDFITYNVRLHQHNAYFFKNKKKLFRFLNFVLFRKLKLTIPPVVSPSE